MTNANGPWSKPRPQKAKPQYHRVLIWIAVMLALILGFVELSRLFPDAISKEDEPYAVYWLALLGFLSSGFLYARRIKFGELAGNIGIWVAISVVLVLGYVYRDAFRSVSDRVRAEFMPSDAVADNQTHTLTLTADSDGDFHVYCRANGMRLRFLVDTGASDIVLSPSDVSRLGVDPKSLKYVRGFETANGIGSGANYTLNELSLGPITMREVPVSINQTAMHASLLGMAFLKRLKSFEFTQRKLYLRW